MSERRLPVCPNLTQLKHQAKDLLRQFRSGDPTAVEEFRKYHPEKISSSEAKLTDAQLVLARSYEASGWTRLVLACKLIDGIWRGDLETVRSIIERNPKLLHENAGIRNSNWGPPMSYAANLGRDAIIRMLYEHGARDLEHAIGRATLQGKIEIAEWLVEKGADVNAKSAVDQNGFGGYTPLFCAVVCYANFWGNYRGEFCDLAPLSWGDAYPAKILVSQPAMRMLQNEAGGHKSYPQDGSRFE